MSEDHDGGVVLEAGKVPYSRLEEALRGGPAPVVFLVLGATEAHGPHLPLSTDTVIGMHLARVGARRVSKALGVPGVVMPPFLATAASCASGFAGTVSVPREVERDALSGTLAALLDQGMKRVCLLTLHFDPEHLAAVRETLEALPSKWRKAVVFPDFTRKEHAQRIGGEFATGDCHAGAFETSLMLVAAPDLVAHGYMDLPERWVGLVRGIREGKRSFEEFGMDRAYCGAPGRAGRAEGERLYEVLSAIVEETCRDQWA